MEESISLVDCYLEVPENQGSVQTHTAVGLHSGLLSRHHTQLTAGHTYEVTTFGAAVLIILLAHEAIKVTFSILLESPSLSHTHTHFLSLYTITLKNNQS